MKPLYVSVLAILTSVTIVGMVWYEILYDPSNWWNNKMKCPKCEHESSSEDLVRNIAECPCDCHKVTHLV